MIPSSREGCIIDVRLSPCSRGPPPPVYPPLPHLEPPVPGHGTVFYHPFFRPCILRVWRARRILKVRRYPHPSQHEEGRRLEWASYPTVPPRSHRYPLSKSLPVWGTYTHAKYFTGTSESHHRFRRALVTGLVRVGRLKLWLPGPLSPSVSWRFGSFLPSSRRYRHFSCFSVYRPRRVRSDREPRCPGVDDHSLSRDPGSPFFRGTSLPLYVEVYAGQIRKKGDAV